MGRASVTAVGFALADGSAADTAGVASVAPIPDRFGRVLLACVEPVELSSRGLELAAVALRAIRETFAATAGTPAEAVAAAFAAANAAVMVQNRPLATGRWERRICVGATAVALAGREIVVAQASRRGEATTRPTRRSPNRIRLGLATSLHRGSTIPRRRPATSSCSAPRVWGEHWLVTSRPSSTSLAARY